MPQLMPLFWIISNFFLFLFLFTMMMIYGDGLLTLYHSMTSKDKNLFYWCW